MKNFLITFKQSKNFVKGKTNREQPYWSEHAKFVEDLFANDIIKLGGPSSDFEKIYILLKVNSTAEAENIFANDPFVINNIFEIEYIKQWHLYLNSTNLD